MIDLRADYEKALRDIVEKRKTADSTDDALYSGMESDLRYALEWMKTGKKPGQVRGIERQSGEYRELCVDPLKMQRYFRSTDSTSYSWDDHHQEDVVGRSDKETLDFALSTLTKHQREIYMLVRGNAFTYSQAGAIMGLKKSAIQSAIDLADAKIAKKLEELATVAS